MKSLAAALSLHILLAGCAIQAPPHQPFSEIEPGSLPPADTALNIPGLGPCTDNPDRTIHLNASQPVNVLVHGCFGSAGEFRSLSQVMAFNGQQSICFTYDDRARLLRSATELRSALSQLSEHTRIPGITVIGHSQGALIARKSLTELPASFPVGETDLRLVTISGPFSGIAAAQTCGRSWLYPLTLGLVPASCYAATGAKWLDITDASEFILQPGALIPRVSRYLKIDTDEKGTCRRMEGSRCAEGDEIFSMSEQRNPQVESDARITRVEVAAGHVEIVGDKRVAPTKLLTILRENGVLTPTASNQGSAFQRLLSRIYALAVATTSE